MRDLWRRLVGWFEHGDLVPLLIVVSAWHYAVILAGRDPWPVAVAIGLLVDLGHYRVVRAAVRYSGRTSQAAARWLVALAMTAVALAYHLRYYEMDWWLAAPIPLLIATLAWLSKVDAALMRAAERPSKTEPAAERPERPAAIAPATESALAATAQIAERGPYVATCEVCGWQRNGYKNERAMRNALNAHKRGCAGNDN